MFNGSARRLSIRKPDPDAIEKLLVEHGRIFPARALPPTIGERLARIHGLLAVLAPPVNHQFPFVGDTHFVDPGRCGPTSAPE
jgi:hypothetical protein